MVNKSFYEFTGSGWLTWFSRENIGENRYLDPRKTQLEKKEYHLTRKSAHIQNGILDPEVLKIW